VCSSDLEFAAGRHLAFLLQAEGRYAIAPTMTGDRTESVTWFQGDISQGPTSSASFWSYERVAGGTTYAAIAFSGAEPTDSDVSSARKGRYDLSGFSLRAGIKFIL
jgi:hypothetical protein